MVTLVAPDGKAFALDDQLVRGLGLVIERLAERDAVRLVDVENELSPQDAANILNVSRQYVTRLLDEGEIPSIQARKGAHRKILEGDVLAYKAKRDARRDRHLQEMVRLTEEAGGYDAAIARIRR